jgi:hypothetical protein
LRRKQYRSFERDLTSSLKDSLHIGKWRAGVGFYVELLVAASRAALHCVGQSGRRDRIDSEVQVAVGGDSDDPCICVVGGGVNDRICGVCHLHADALAELLGMAEA